MTLGGPIFTWMTNEIDQDVISLSAGPDCNRRHGVRHRQSAEEDEEAGAARINFEFHAASGDLGERSGNRSLLIQFVRGHFLAIHQNYRERKAKRLRN